MKRRSINKVRLNRNINWKICISLTALAAATGDTEKKEAGKASTGPPDPKKASAKGTAKP